jgi:hypothetical protein
VGQRGGSTAVGKSYNAKYTSGLTSFLCVAAPELVKHMELMKNKIWKTHESGTFCFSSVVPGKFQDNMSITLLSHPSQSFPIHHPPVIVPLHVI